MKELTTHAQMDLELLWTCVFFPFCLFVTDSIYSVILCLFTTVCGVHVWQIICFSS